MSDKPTTKELIVFAEDWGALPTSSQHIIGELCKQGWVVLWVNSIGLRCPKFNAKDIRRTLSKCFRILKKAIPSGKNSKLHKNLYILEPIYIPIFGSKLIDNVNRKIMKFLISKRVSSLGLKNPILWASLPTAIKLVPVIKHRALIYYCCDDFISLSGVDHQYVAKLEKKLVLNADRIITVNHMLAKKFPEDKTLIVPHGVHYEKFTANNAYPKDLPKKSNIAGFYGTISEWFDVNLMTRVAKALPDWSFIFIGDVLIDVSSLMELNNTHFLGKKRHEELPGYVQHWDVSLLPFVINDQINSCNPLKLREYLASGAPIVTTEFPEVIYCKDLVGIAKSTEEFVKLVLMSSNDNKRELRQSFVATESWRERVKNIEELVLLKV